MHIREPVIAALETVGHFEVIDAEQVQNRRVQVVDMDLVLDGVKAKLIRLAIDDARFDAAPSHPDGVAMRMMVAPFEYETASNTAAISDG